MKKTIFACFLACTVCATTSGAAEEEAIIKEVQRIPRVLPTADELANPHLYRPQFETAYVPPAASLLPPPPAGVVRPGEFDEMDSTLINVLNYGAQFTRMWVEMLEVYSQSETHTWIITTTAGKNMIEPKLQEAAIPSDSYTYLFYPLDSIWVRDCGPEFVVEEDGTRHIIDASYSGRPNDDRIPIRVGASDWVNSDGSPLEVHSHNHGLAGGNIMTDGAGTCFFSNIIYGYEKPQNWTDEEVDDLLKESYGCEQIITLTPIARDSTQHVDLYAKLVGPTSILLGEFDPDTHFPADYTTQEENLATLEATTNLDGEPWTITRMPMLEPYNAQMFWVYRTYMNSEIVNNHVAMPSYYQKRNVTLPDGNDETVEYLLDMEAKAIEAYETARPGVQVTPIDSDHIISQGGAIHCISHEVPVESSGGWEPPEEFCGDGEINGDEECEKGILDETTCEDLGFASGKLQCNGIECVFNTTKCESAPDGGPDADADTDTDSDTDADAGSDGDTDADSDTDGNEDAGVDDDSGDDSCGCRAVGSRDARGVLDIFLSLVAG